MLCKKLLRKRATLQDIYRLYQVVVRVPKLLAVLKDLDCVTINNALYDPIQDALSVCIFIASLALFLTLLVYIFDSSDSFLSKYPFLDRNWLSTRKWLSR